MGQLLKLYDAAPEIGNSPIQNEILTEDGFVILTEDSFSILLEDSIDG